MWHAARPPAIVIAFARRQVGIALPAPDGFALVATDPEFELLDGSSFRRLELLEAAAQSMARAVAGEDRSEVIAVPIARGDRYRTVGPADAVRYALESMSMMSVDKLG